jgi:L-alanine-DL-glutamate epimerase-like enolase superfamily enzyme
LPQIVDVRAKIIEVPLRRAFVTAKDKLARMVSSPVVITFTLDDRSHVVGEAVPVEYVTGETQETVLVDVEAATPALIGGDVLRLMPIIHQLLEALPNSPTARAGLEIALHNAHSQAIGVPIWKLLGGTVESVETDVTLSISDDAIDHAKEAASRGFRFFKMKVGSEDREADFRRVIEVQKAVPHARLRLDANQAFSANEALDFIRRTVAAGVKLDLVEQPVSRDDLAALNQVAAASPVPIFADEAVLSPADALRLVNETCVQGINVKLMKSGISGALDIIAIARAAGRRLMIGCMLETRRGISASLAVACGTGAFEFVDLDSHLLLREKGENPYFVHRGPVLEAGRSSHLV